MVGCDVPFYVKIGRNWPTPFKNANFQSISARSASALEPSEKSTTSFPMILR